MSVELARQQAWQLYTQTDLPSKRDEAWKYTDISSVQTLLDATAEVDGASQAQGASLPDLEMDAYRIVLKDGVVQDVPADLPEGVSIVALARFLPNLSDNQAKHVVKLFEIDGKEPLFNALMAYNAAKASDGVALCLADGVELKKPLYIVHTGSQTSHVRHAFSLGKAAKVEIIEHFAAGEADKALSNISSNIMLGEGAHCEHYRLQLEGKKQTHFSRVEVKQNRDSSYTLHAVELGGLLSRSDIVVNLAEQGASCTLNGLFVLGDRQHADHHTRVDHRAAHCNSKENYRTVLDGRSHGVFNGKVVVHKGAVKTDSAQSNANLLLSNKAEIDSKPELEIYNDDVKCAHGATVGQLDQAQLFYLRSRGLSESEAKEVLTFAFADQVLTAMGNEAVRSFVEKEAFSKLPHSGDLDGLLG